MNEIQQRYDTAIRSIRSARRAIEHAQNELQAVQDDCSHANAFMTSHTGENCRHCPDCQACDV